MLRRQEAQLAQRKSAGAISNSCSRSSNGIYFVSNRESITLTAVFAQVISNKWPKVTHITHFDA